MDFVSGLPKTRRKHDMIWVIMDRFTKSAHFLPIHKKATLEEMAKLYVNEIVCVHEISMSIISDRDPHFTARFWKKQQALGTQLKFSSAFHH